jgi:acyl-CoA synthetase (NDP forming)
MNSKLDRLFSPQSIAVVGASNDAGKLGHQYFRRLTEGFTGRVIAVTPSRQAVLGRETVARIADIDGNIDVLIALVPAERLLETVRDCPAGKVGYLLAVPSGFAEVPGQGRARQEELVAAARAKGMRVIGPNTAGFFSSVAGLNGSLMPSLPPGGRGLSCITQSGGFGMALTMFAQDNDLKVARFCDIGNLGDLTYAELLTYLRDDPETTVVGLFMESAPDTAATRAALASLAARKPVLLCPATRTVAGRRASFVHLGVQPALDDLLANPPDGVTVVETGLDLLNTAKLLACRPGRVGRRLGVITGTGGIGAEIGDLAIAAGLEMPALSADLQERIGEGLPSYAGRVNPVDVTPIWRDYPRLYPEILDKLARSGEVDAVILSITDVPTTLPDLADALCRMEKPAIPVIVYWGSRDADTGRMYQLQAAGFPCYRSTREAVLALAAAARCTGSAPEIHA